MYRHRPSCLEGPVSRTSGQWAGNEAFAVDRKPGSQGDRLEKPSPDASEIRTELVQRIRREIAEGHYETPEKWEAALQALWQRMQDADPGA